MRRQPKLNGAAGPPGEAVKATVRFTPKGVELRRGKPLTDCGNVNGTGNDAKYDMGHDHPHGGHLGIFY